jgi:hypothetical protein
MFLLRLYLWLAPVALLLACLVVFLYRGFQKQFPVFLAYIVVELAHSLTLIVIVALLPHSPRSLEIYRWALVLGTGMTAILACGALYELASMLLLSHSSLGRTLRPLPRWSAAVLVLLAAASSALLSSRGMEQVMGVFQTLDFSTNLVKIGLLLTLVLFGKVLGISWTGVPEGIVLGFGVFAGVEVGAAPLFSALGPGHYIAVDLIRMSGFHVSVMLWLVYLLRPVKPRSRIEGDLTVAELESLSEQMRRIAQS